MLFVRATARLLSPDNRTTTATVAAWYVTAAVPGGEAVYPECQQPLACDQLQRPELRRIVWWLCVYTGQAGRDDGDDPFSQPVTGYRYAR